MSNDRRSTTIGELLSYQGGSIKTGPFGTKLKAAEYTRDGVPVISVGEIEYGRLSLRSETPHVNASVTSRMPEYLLHEGDIVFGRKGAVDRSARVRGDQSGWFLGSDGIRLRLPDSCDSAFVAYQLLLQTHRNWMLQHAAGSTMPSLNEGIIRQIPILLPRLDEQRAIAGVLGALDDKIEQNRLAAAALERLARAIFRAWFVDFEPVKAKAAGATSFPSLPQAAFDSLPTRFMDSEIGPIPARWDVGTVESAATLSKLQVKPHLFLDETFEHFSIPAYDDGKRSVLEPGTAIKSNKFAVAPECVLVSKLNPRIPRIWLPGASTSGNRQLASTEFLVTVAKPNWSRNYLYCLLSPRWV